MGALAVPGAWRRARLGGLLLGVAVFGASCLSGAVDPAATTAATGPTVSPSTMPAAPITTVTSTPFPTSSTLAETITTTSESVTTTTTSQRVTPTTTIAPGPEITTPSTRPLPPVRSVSVDDPLRVWVIGDSLVATVGPVIAGEPSGLLEATVDFRSGSGLVSPFFFDWPAFIARRAPEVDPEAVIVLVGANDAQAIRGPGGDLAFGTPEWVSAYRDLSGSAMDLLDDGATRIYWVGPPIMRDPGYSERMALVNQAFEAVIDDRPGVTFVDAFALFRDVDGRYSDVLPDRDGVVVQMREGDGIHYTAAGGRHLARDVLEVISEQWGLDLGG